MTTLSIFLIYLLTTNCIIIYCNERIYSFKSSWPYKLDYCTKCTNSPYWFLCVSFRTSWGTLLTKFKGVSFWWYLPWFLITQIARSVAFQHSNITTSNQTKAGTTSTLFELTDFPNIKYRYSWLNFHNCSDFAISLWKVDAKCMNREICEYTNVPKTLIMDYVGFIKLSLFASQSIIFQTKHVWL